MEENQKPSEVETWIAAMRARQDLFDRDMEMIRQQHALNEQLIAQIGLRLTEISLENRQRAREERERAQEERESAREAARRFERQMELIGLRFQDTREMLDRLANIAGIHEDRLDEHEERLDKLDPR